MRDSLTRPGAPGRRARVALAPALAAGAVLLIAALGGAFALGRWSGDPAPSPGACVEDSLEVTHAAAGPDPDPPTRGTSRVAPTGRPAVGDVASPSTATPSVAVTPELVARAADEAHDRLEALRARVVARCWPPGGLAGGATSTRLAFNLAFDPRGREIARGIIEDRAAPAAEFVSCLRDLDGAALSISPPRANVSVTVTLAFP